MSESFQSLHGLPIVNYDNVSRSNKQSIVKSNHGNNVPNVSDKKKNKPAKQKTDVKRSKSKPRRRSPSHKDIKKTLSVYSCCVNQLIPSRNKATRSRNAKNKRTSGRKNKQMEVLFSSEARKQKNNLIYDIYNPNAVDVVKNVKNKPIENLKNQQIPTYSNATKVPKPGIQYINEHNSTALHGNLCIANSKSNHSNDIPAQFRVVHFPNYDQTDTELEAINMNRNSETYNILYTPEKHREEKEVYTCLPRRPRSRDVQKGGGDAGTQCKCSRKDATSIGVQCSCVKKKCVNKNKPKNPCLEDILDPFLVHKNALCCARSGLKYFIFALALIVWSPCLITIYLCWFITYPLRPSCNRPCRVPNPTCRPMPRCQGCLLDLKENCTQTSNNDNDIWSKILKAIQPVAVAIEACKSLFSPNSDKDNLGCAPCLTPRTRQRPNLKNSLPCKLRRVVIKKKIEPCCAQIDDKKSNAVGRRSSCRGHAGNYSTRNNKNNFCHRHHRHRHLCADNSQLSKPIINNILTCKPCSKNSTCPAFKMINPKEICKGCKKLTRTERIDLIMKKHKLADTVWQCSKVNCKHLKTAINEADRSVFGDRIKTKVNCQEIYIKTLRSTPWCIVYKMCPTFYPMFLGICNFYKQFWHFILLLISACIWCPLLVFWYLCYKVCQCL